MSAPPRVPHWVRWSLARLLAPDELRLVLSDLVELRERRVASLGRKEAARRWRRELRWYPFRLLADRLRGGLRPDPERGGLKGLRGVGWGASPRALLQSARSLARAPGLGLAIVLTVGIGVGGCTAIFAVVDALFLRPLPYPAAERLVWIYTDSPPNRWPFSVVDFQALEAQQSSFAGLAAYTTQSRALVTTEATERISVVSATARFFEVLGIQLLAGRPPTESEGAPGAEPTTLVTRDFAARQLGSVTPEGTDALGRFVNLDGRDHRVIGVLPSRFGPVGRTAEVYPTLQLELPTRKGPFFLMVLGRLRPEIDAPAATAELRAINRRLFPLWADSYQDERASWGTEDLARVLRGDADRLLIILMGAMAMLLLIATVNAANLLLARVNGRRQELAVRTALGASRGRIVGHLLTESALLAAGGVVVGLLVARGAIEILPLVASSYIPRLSEVRLSGTVLGFAALLAVGSGLLFGLIPALRGGAGQGLPGGLRARGRIATGTVGEQRSQRILVAGQIAIATPLLAGAALLLASFAKLQSLEPGFRAESLLSMRVSPPRGGYADPETRAQLWERVLDRVSALPGVVSVGLANGRPPVERSVTNNFELEDRPTPPGQSQPTVPWIIADRGYFETLGIPLLAGRTFEAFDDLYDPEVALVDETWARRFFPGEDAVGRRFRHGGCATCPWTTVVGVVGDVPYAGLGRLAEGVVYQPDPKRGSAEPFLFVRTTGDPTVMVPMIRNEVRRVDPTVPVTRVETGEELMRNSLTQPRHLTLLLVVFAAVALGLAVVGLYGITTYSVQQRRGDIAIRLALGGSPAAVLGMVVGQGMRLAAAGLTIGVVAALALTRVLSGLLYEVSPHDPLSLAGVALVLAAVSLAACLVPGRRAVGLDPVVALREE